MKPGDRVICIDDRNWHHVPVMGICEGIIYTISEIFTCECGNVYVRLAEVTQFANMWCAKCDNTSHERLYYYIERFRLLDQIENTVEEVIGEKESVFSLN